MSASLVADDETKRRERRPGSCVLYTSAFPANMSYFRTEKLAQLDTNFNLERHCQTSYKSDRFDASTPSASFGSDSGRSAAEGSVLVCPTQGHMCQKEKALLLFGSTPSSVVPFLRTGSGHRTKP